MSIVPPERGMDKLTIAALFAAGIIVRTVLKVRDRSPPPFGMKDSNERTALTTTFTNEPHLTPCPRPTPRTSLATSPLRCSCWALASSCGTSAARTSVDATSSQGCVCATAHSAIVWPSGVTASRLHPLPSILSNYSVDSVTTTLSPTSSPPPPSSCSLPARPTKAREAHKSDVDQLTAGVAAPGKHPTLNEFGSGLSAAGMMGGGVRGMGGSSRLGNRGVGGRRGLDPTPGGGRGSRSGRYAGTSTTINYAGTGPLPSARQYAAPRPVAAKRTVRPQSRRPYTGRRKTGKGKLPAVPAATAGGGDGAAMDDAGALDALGETKHKGETSAG